jgi:citrate synthase
MSENKNDQIATYSSFVDGQKGVLIYRGYDIRDLGANSTFEEVVYLLWNGELPTAHELDLFKAAIQSKRALPEPLLNIMRDSPMTLIQWPFFAPLSAPWVFLTVTPIMSRWKLLEKNRY